MTRGSWPRYRHYSQRARKWTLQSPCLAKELDNNYFSIVKMYQSINATENHLKTIAFRITEVSENIELMKEKITSLEK